MPMIFCTNNDTRTYPGGGSSEWPGLTNRWALSGVLVIDKDPGVSSFGVVSKVRKILGVRKAGHTGTLDPFATGVLVVCLGQATRIIPFLDEGAKEYLYTIRFGAETDTWDLTGKVIREAEVAKIKRSTLETVIASLTGNIELPVPRFSAIRMGGKRLYKMAREGIEFVPPVRRTQIFSMELVDFRWPEIVLKTQCGKGTYVRSIAHVIGEKLGVPGYVKDLRRLRSGRFAIEEAVTLDLLRKPGGKNRILHRIISMSSALDHLPLVKIDRSKADFIRKGGAQAVELGGAQPNSDTSQLARIVSDENDLVAIARIDREENRLKIIKVFPDYNGLS